MRLLPVALVLLLGPLSSSALAQETASRGASAIERSVRRALEALSAHEVDAASQILEEATTTDPNHVFATYLLGEAHRMAGRVDAAVEAYRRALQLAGTDTRMDARARIGLARTLESQRERYAEAREAWIAYVRFAETHPEAPSAEVARARIQALDLVAEQEAAYPEVRRRISERAAATNR